MRIAEMVNNQNGSVLLSNMFFINGWRLEIIITNIAQYLLYLLAFKARE
jgi:hypothetical protein